MGLLKLTGIILFALLVLISTTLAGGFENMNVGLKATAITLGVWLKAARSFPLVASIGIGSVAMIT